MSKRSVSTSDHSAEESIRVRMYNVGFGDSFLLWVPTSKGIKRILIDCGFHSQGKGKFSDRELVSQIRDHLEGEPLDVVVATHRHQDHISGFGEIDLWNTIEVREVWLPFTAAEDSDPNLGLVEWDRLLAAATTLLAEDGTLTSGARSALGSRSKDECDAVEWILWNARANAGGIENLRHGMKQPGGRPAQRRYLPGEEVLPACFTTPVLPEVTIHVLGPARDVALRRKRKAPAGWGIDDLTGGTNEGSDARERSLFGEEWRFPEAELPTRLPFTQRSLQSIAKLNDDLSAVASAVDGFLNGESLVLLFEVGDARLLFPGDAEVSAWMEILGTAKARELASSATFLKFGHHGSHNATPLAFLERDLGRGITAMMSTQEGAGAYRNGIPRPELLSAVSSRQMPFARTDLPPGDGDKSSFIVGPEQRWVDCTLPVRTRQ